MQLRTWPAPDLEVQSPQNLSKLKATLLFIHMLHPDVVYTRYGAFGSVVMVRKLPTETHIYHEISVYWKEQCFDNIAKEMIKTQAWGTRNKQVGLKCSFWKKQNILYIQS